MSIFDLINSQNVRAREISDSVDNKDMENANRLSSKKSPLKEINELLKSASLDIVITIGKDDALFASKKGSPPYSIAELSDGERNALLICSDVLTTPPNHLIILDEPERHLHRSIISPLLTSLFQKRSDCVFVVSTHEVSLPTYHKEASVLLLRSCQWEAKTAKSWDADLIDSGKEISDEVKHDILGAKRKILFVEGESNSLDRQIYQLIFPEVSVNPQGNCGSVEKAVAGIKNTRDLHWIEAFGLIDKDNRTPEQIQVLLENGIVALPSYSVESLYYNLEIVKRIAKRESELIGGSEEGLYEAATSNIINDIAPHKERLCAKLCEKRIKNEILKSLPNAQEIQSGKGFQNKDNTKELYDVEKAVFDKLISEKDLNELICRYPVRETPVLKNIAYGLGLKRDAYEGAVRKLILDDTEVRSIFRTMLSPLTELINPG